MSSGDAKENVGYVISDSFRWPIQLVGMRTFGAVTACSTRSLFTIQRRRQSLETRKVI